MARKGTKNAAPQQCMYITAWCWLETDSLPMCFSPAAPIFLSSWGWGLSFEGFFWPCCFSATPLQASGSHKDEYHAVLRQQLLPWSCVLMPSPLPLGHPTVLVTSSFSSVECERIALTWYSKRWLFISSLQNKPGLGISWRKRALCCSRQRGTEPD